MNKKVKFLKKHKGYLLSSLAVILGYPLVYLFQNKHIIPLDTFGMLIPFSFAGIFITSLPYRLLLNGENKL